MDNAGYVALSLQGALFRKLEVHANNMANANTSGYQSDAMMFTDYLTNDGNHQKVAYTHDVGMYRNTQAGPLKSTGNPLDAAISGKGYFRVETPGGERYTRSGNFQIDANGTLVTSEGNPVLDTDGARIVFEPADKNIEIKGNGSIMVNGGDQRGQLGVVQFNNEQLLKRVSGTMLSSEVPGQQAEGASVIQGALEGSNVQAVTELTSIMELSRGVANASKYMETIDSLERKAISAYGKVLA